VELCQGLRAVHPMVVPDASPELRGPVVRRGGQWCGATGACDGWC